MNSVSLHGLKLFQLSSEWSKALVLLSEATECFMINYSTILMHKALNTLVSWSSHSPIQLTMNRPIDVSSYHCPLWLVLPLIAADHITVEMIKLLIAMD